MSIQEYVVADDFFRCDEENIIGIDFPCCCCIHQKKAANDDPCKFCGHNLNFVNHYQCVICGEFVEGNYNDPDAYIAPATKSRLGPLCSTCISNLTHQRAYLKNTCKK